MASIKEVAAHAGASVAAVSRVLNEMEDEARAVGYTAASGNADERAEQQDPYVRAFIEERVDGLPVCPAAEVTPVVEDCIAADGPLVFLDRTLPGMNVPTLGATDPAGLLARGPRSAVITHGADGSVVADRTGVTEIPSPRVEAVDTTGAGDAFTGALSLRLARGDDLATAARLAARICAAAVRKPGVQSPFPTLDDLCGAQ